MKKRLISIVLTVLLLGTLFVPAASAKERFTDISGHWAEECIVRLAEAEIVHGYPDGSVKPDRAITRGEFASLLVHAAGFDTEANGPWPQKYFDALSAHGVLEGGEERSGDRLITRMELITWTIRAMECKKYSIKDEEILKFPDTGDLSETEIGYLTAATASGLLTGYPDGTVRPGANCTRAEAFMIISKYEKAKEFLEGASHPGISAGTGLPQMSVSLEGPETAEAYSPIEIKVHHKNVEKLEWTITGNEDKSQRSNSVWESDLNEDGGTVTFYEAGHYDLHAKAYSGAGQEGEYLLGIEVMEPAIRLEAPEEIPVYHDTHIEAHPRSDVTDLVWTITRDGEPAQAGAYFGTLENTGGTISFQQDGIYKLTLSGKDGLGKPVSASCSILSYRQIWQSLYGPDTAYVGVEAFYSMPDFTLGEGAKTKWQVLENEKVLDWDSVIDGTLNGYYGGNLKFQRTGDFTIRLKITDRLGHVTNSEKQTKVYEPVPKPKFQLPPVAYTDTPFTVSCEEISNAYELEWSYSMEDSDTEGFLSGNLDRSGGTLTISRAGQCTITATVKDHAGNTQTASQSLTVKKKPHIRMNPLDRVTHEERFDYVDILQASSSVASYPDFTDTEGMTITFMLLENGEKAGEDAAYFYDRTTNYSFQPKRAGDFVVQAKAEDSYGNSFTFTTQIKVVPVVEAEIAELPETIGLGETVSVSVIPRNLTDETVTWKLLTMPEDTAAPHIKQYGLKNIWFVKDGWQKIELSDVSEGSLSETGGQLHFRTPGIYCLRTSVTDQYGFTVERPEVFRIIGN